MPTDPRADFDAARARFSEAVADAVALPTHAGALAATDAAIEEYNRAVNDYNDNQDDLKPMQYPIRNGHAATLTGQRGSEPTT